MAYRQDDVAWLLSDSCNVIVQVLANDPRAVPTEGLFVVANGSDMSLADLEALPAQLQSECGWGMGYHEDLKKSSGGIGADGATIVSLILGVVGAVPTIESLLRKLGRETPALPTRDNAWETATWAVAMQYESLVRRELHPAREERHSDHWTFRMSSEGGSDTFEVDVYGSRGGTIATRVAWTNGDASGNGPGRN